MPLSRADFVTLCERARADPAPLLASAFWIETKNLEGQEPVGRLVLNRAQTAVHEALLAQRAAGQPQRGIVCKARQPGISTYGAGRLAATGLCMPHSHSMMVTHLEQASTKLFQKIHFMYRHLPLGLRPKFRTSRREELTIEGMPCADGAQILGSDISVATAGGEEQWRSTTLQSVHISEFAMCRRPEELLLGILQCVPLHNDTMVLIESTARGIGNAFHTEWLRAKEGQSAFVPIFIAWCDVPEYQMPVPDGLQFDPDEIELQKRYHLTPEQLVWRRYVINTQCLGDVDLFDQEYPINDAVAFLMSGRPAFNHRKLYEMFEEASRRPFTRGEVRLDGTGMVEAPRGRFKCYREPEPDHDYVVSGDPASGIEGGDPTCCRVFDRTREEFVATWHGALAPVPTAQVLSALGLWYNTAVVVPELSGGHGFSVVEELKNHQYPRIYVWSRADKVRHGVTNFYGWETSYRTRPLLIDSMNEAINTDSIFDPDPEAVKELLEFQWQDGRAEGTGHDDRAMASMIAYRVHLEYPLPTTGMPPRVRYKETAAAEKVSPLYAALSRSHQEIWDDTRRVEKQMMRSERTGFVGEAEFLDAEPSTFDDFDFDLPW